MTFSKKSFCDVMVFTLTFSLSSSVIITAAPALTKMFLNYQVDKQSCLNIQK